MAEFKFQVNEKQAWEASKNKYDQNNHPRANTNMVLEVEKQVWSSRNCQKTNMESQMKK